MTAPEQMSGTSSTLLAEVRLLDPASGLDAVGFLGISGPRIVHVGLEAPPQHFDQTVDGQGRWVMPGLVDLCARFREPGATHKATIRSEVAAAQAGGITTVCIPPDTRPVIDTPSVVDRIAGRLAQVGGLEVQVLGALTQGLEGNALPDMAALAASGVVAVTNALAPLANALIARRALEYARGCGLSVHVVPIEHTLAGAGCAHEGPVATRLGLATIPTAAETVVIAQWLALVEQTGARVHFGRLSSARGVAMIEDAQARGLPVSADVAAHQLFLTEDDLDGYNVQCHVVPPLRSEQDRIALRAAVQKGVVSAICSDHQPHEPDAKVNPFPMTEPGISALETLLPLVLSLVHEQRLTPLEAAARLSTGPASVLGLPPPRLEAGQPAHLALIDPDTPWRLQAAAMRSAGQNTPFDGWRFRGRVVRTYFAGQPVYAAG